MTTRQELAKLFDVTIEKRGGKLINPTGSIAWGTRAGEIYAEGIIARAAKQAADEAGQGWWGEQKTKGVDGAYDYNPPQLVAILDQLREMKKRVDMGRNLEKAGITDGIIALVEQQVTS